MLTKARFGRVVGCRGGGLALSRPRVERLDELHGIAHVDAPLPTDAGRAAVTRGRVRAMV
jgi:hypothetical protein